MICDYCKRDVEKVEDIRGRKACLHCQLDFIWDFMEGTRRMIGNKKEKHSVHAQAEGVNDIVKSLEELYG